MKLPFYGVAVIAMCLFISCRSSSQNDLAKPSTQDITLEDVNKNADRSSNETADSMVVPTEVSNNETLQSGSPAFTDWDKKIVKTANISLEVKDYHAFDKNIHTTIKNFGGYTAAEQQSTSDSRIENSLTLKVPVDQFDNFVNIIGGDGITVLSKDVSSEDVSNEVIDTKARMEAKKQLRDKYEELLKEAKTMKDILQVQSEINGIQEELETAAGRINYLTHSAAYSTVTINYFQYLNGTTSDSTQPGFFADIKEAFATGGSVFVNIIVFLVSIWPLLLAGGLLYIYFKREKPKKVTA